MKMGVLTLDAYTRQKFQGATRYYRPKQQIPGKFKALVLDANPLVYAAAMKAFEYGDSDCVIRENDHLSYDEKIQLVFQYTWEEMFDLVQVVDCDEVFIALDGVAPEAKCYQQRRRRYPRLPVPAGEFDATLISAGTQFMHDLCGFIRFKLQKEWIKESVQKVYFSGHTCPGEGEHKGMQYLRSLAPKSRVMMFGPDGDLIMLGLLTNLDFFLFKVDHNTRNGYDKRYYTIKMGCIKPQIAKWTPGTHIIDATKTFVFLGSFLGNDFLPKLEIFDVFISGVDDLYSRYLKLGKSLMVQGRLDKNVFTNLLYMLAKEEPQLLEQRTKHPFPLLEKHLTKEGQGSGKPFGLSEKLGKLDFQAFRLEYYTTWLKINEDQVAQVCYNYLDTLWWTWIYYSKACPQFGHHYKYLYPPFLCDLAIYSRHWKIPFFKKDVPRTPFQQLVAILPPSRKELLPEAYHHLFEGPEFPDATSINVNTQGKGEFEYVYEIPTFTSVIDVDVPLARNRVDGTRVFTRGEQEYWVINKKYGEFITNVEG